MSTQTNKKVFISSIIMIFMNQKLDKKTRKQIRKILIQVLKTRGKGQEAKRRIKTLADVARSLLDFILSSRMSSQRNHKYQNSVAKFIQIHQQREREKREREKMEKEQQKYENPPECQLEQTVINSNSDNSNSNSSIDIEQLRVISLFIEILKYHDLKDKKSQNDKNKIKINLFKYINCEFLQRWVQKIKTVLSPLQEKFKSRIKEAHNEEDEEDDDEEQEKYKRKQTEEQISRNELIKQLLQQFKQQMRDGLEFEQKLFDQQIKKNQKDDFYHSESFFGLQQEQIQKTYHIQDFFMSSNSFDHEELNA